MFDVICVGSATVDVFAHTDKSELFNIKSSQGDEAFLAYPAGSKVIIQELIFTIGGGGTNTSCALSRLGLKTAFLGEIGNDEHGEMILQFLKKENISFIGKRGLKRTGYSMILDSLNHDRTILTYKGCNDSLQFSVLNKNKLKSKWMYFSSMMGESFTMLEDLSQFAKKKGISICFNPSSYLVSQGIEHIKTILDNTSILVLNAEEAKDLCKNHLIGKTDKMEDLLRSLRQYVALVVITDGKKGAYAIDEKFIYHAKSHRIKVVETTGAGDAFASTFLCSYSKTKNIKRALSLAVTNAESVLLHHGSKNNLLFWNALNVAVRKKPVTIKIKKC